MHSGKYGIPSDYGIKNQQFLIYFFFKFFLNLI